LQKDTADIPVAEIAARWSIRRPPSQTLRQRDQDHPDAVIELRSQGEIVNDDLLAHVAPLGCEQITFNGDYVWPTEPLQNDFRPPSGHCGILAKHS
jgi:hypothetical protein